MKKLTIDHKNGHSTTYQLIEDGNNLPLAYKIATSKKVIEVLERCRKNRIRVKLNYGNIQTGKSWNEEHDTIGYVSMSKGYEARFPILVYNERAYGGGSLMDDNVLKITESKGSRVLYEAENFQLSTFEIKESTEAGYTHSLYIGGELYSNHKTERAAKMLLKKLS
jgi:hypothetical protein